MASLSYRYRHASTHWNPSPPPPPKDWTDRWVGIPPANACMYNCLRNCGYRFFYLEIVVDASWWAQDVSLVIAVVRLVLCVLLVWREAWCFRDIGRGTAVVSVGSHLWSRTVQLLHCKGGYMSVFTAVQSQLTAMNFGVGWGLRHNCWLNILLSNRNQYCMLSSNAYIVHCFVCP